MRLFLFALLAVGVGIALIFGYPFQSVITDNSSSEKTGPDLTRLESIPAGAIDGERIIDADREPGSWLSHARTYDEQRFSPLSQVNADNALVREMLNKKVDGSVLVVDGGASFQTALLGGNLATLAERNVWSGVVIYGCIRDVQEIKLVDIGCKAIG